MQYRFDSSIYLKAFDKMLIIGTIFQVFNFYMSQSKILFYIICGIIILGLMLYGYLFLNSRNITLIINNVDITFEIKKEKWIILWNEISMITMDGNKNIYIHPKDDEDNPFLILGDMENIDKIINGFAKQCKMRNIKIRFALF